MLKYLRHSRAQVIGEYAITIAILISALVAMTVYARRALQARMHDAKEYMVSEASQGGVTILSEYEPYYGDSQSESSTTSDEQTVLAPGLDTKVFSGRTEISGRTRQLPPSAAGD